MPPTGIASTAGGARFHHQHQLWRYGFVEVVTTIMAEVGPGIDVAGGFPARFVFERDRRSTDDSDPQAVLGQVAGGSVRSIVPTRSIDRSNEAMRLTPELSAEATRYASAKSMRSSS